MMEGERDCGGGGVYGHEVLGFDSGLGGRLLRRRKGVRYLCSKHGCITA